MSRNRLPKGEEASRLQFPIKSCGSTSFRESRCVLLQAHPALSGFEIGRIRGILLGIADQEVSVTSLRKAV
jgi:hypothetical protein